VSVISLPDPETETVLLRKKVEAEEVEKKGHIEGWKERSIMKRDDRKWDEGWAVDAEEELKA
jgi:hypothetical protein